LYRILPLGDQRVIIDDHRSTQLQASVLQRTVRTTVGSVGLQAAVSWCLMWFVIQWTVHLHRFTFYRTSAQ